MTAAAMTSSFDDIQDKLDSLGRPDTPLIDRVTSGFFGMKNPFSRKAVASEHEVWLLDNTAYLPANQNGTTESWEAEFVACFFSKGRKDITDAVSRIADVVGLDSMAGSNDVIRKRIEQRIRPFIQAVAPARTIDITVSHPDQQDAPRSLILGPSDGNGISSQVFLTGGKDADGKTVECSGPNSFAGYSFAGLQNNLYYAGKQGWAIISDIDDSIKVTQTPSPIGILKTTFCDEPQTTEGLPEFYKTLDAHFNQPAWFYLSASPYNLYPFLHQFLKQNYPHGTMILRDASWMYFGGLLLQSLTQNVKAYKVDRIKKIHSWLPNRKYICVGDSTQEDPESYAQIYTEFPGMIKAIYIRKVVDAPNMDEKNKPERFQKAFKDVPDDVWRLFLTPAELADHAKQLQ